MATLAELGPSSKFDAGAPVLTASSVAVSSSSGAAASCALPEIGGEMRSGGLSARSRWKTEQPATLSVSASKPAGRRPFLGMYETIPPLLNIAGGASNPAV